MERLISMTDFVLKYSQKSKTGYEAAVKALEGLNLIKNYAKYLKQKIELCMFVPCKLVDGLWIVLDYVEKPLSPNTEENWNKWTEYKEAKDRVLFEGFNFKSNGVYCSENTVIQQYKEGSFCLFNILGENTNTVYVEVIEDLVKYNLKLTPTAKSLKN